QAWNHWNSKPTPKKTMRTKKTTMKTSTSTRTTRKKKRRKRTKKSSSLLLLALLAPVFGGEKKEAAYAIVAVTVFREPGFSLPGAEVSLTPDPAPDAAPGQKTAKPRKATCDARGEYAFRVSPEPKSYLIRASAKGFHTEEKHVQIQGESERAEVTLELHAESGPSR